mmetsp:Transcript_94/g.190  ORF Transcript_94/g.190 Transcript_94/m.190 type:complete len:105 (+) Transcript_94:284-598(+)
MLPPWGHHDDRPLAGPLLHSMAPAWQGQGFAGGLGPGMGLGIGGGGMGNLGPMGQGMGMLGGPHRGMLGGPGLGLGATMGGHSFTNMNASDVTGTKRPGEEVSI